MTLSTPDGPLQIDWARAERERLEALRFSDDGAARIFACLRDAFHHGSHRLEGFLADRLPHVVDRCSRAVVIRKVSLCLASGRLVALRRVTPPQPKAPSNVSTNRPMRQWATICLVLILALLCAPAEADTLPHHDLRTLFYVAEVVVKAEKVRERLVSSSEYVDYRVLESYQGPFKAGDILTVRKHGYQFSPGFGKKWPTPDPGHVLFVRSDGPHLWQVVSSGLRIRVDHHWKRFAQSWSFGYYAPVPQHSEHDRTVTSDERELGLRDTSFERELRVAKRGADAVRKALVGGAVPEILDLVGPSSIGRRRRARFRDEDCHWDKATGKLIRHLEKVGSLDDLLEGVARAPAGVWLLPATTHPPRDLVRAATSTTTPTHRRMAALRLLGLELDPPPPPLQPRLLALLQDPEPRIRAALLEHLGTELHAAALEAAVVKAWPGERDRGVRFQMLVNALRGKFQRRLPPGDPAEMWVERPMDAVIVHRSIRNAPDWTFRDVEVELVHITSKHRYHPTQAQQSDGVLSRQDAFDFPPEGLPLGRYQVWVDSYVDGPGGATHHTRMRADDWVLEVTANGTTTPPPSSSGLAASPRPEKTIDLPPAPGRACSCTAAGEPFPPHRGGLALLLWCGLWVCRRTSRYSL